MHVCCSADVHIAQIDLPLQGKVASTMEPWGVTERTDRSSS